MVGGHQAGFAEEEALLERGDLAGAAEQQARMWLAPDAAAEVRELTDGDDSYARTTSSSPSTGRCGPSGRSRRRRPAWASSTCRRCSSSATPTGRELLALAERLARELPDARLETIDGAGHLPSLERPDELNRLLLDFLQ